MQISYCEFKKLKSAAFALIFGGYKKIVDLITINSNRTDDVPVVFKNKNAVLNFSKFITAFASFTGESQRTSHRIEAVLVDLPVLFIVVTVIISRTDSFIYRTAFIFQRVYKKSHFYLLEIILIRLKSERLTLGNFIQLFPVRQVFHEL